MTHSHAPSFKRAWIVCSVVATAVLLLTLTFTAVPATHAAGSPITGAVTDPDGGPPPPHTRVTLRTPDGAEFGVALVDAGGAFSFGPVPNGSYTLRAHPPAGSPHTPSLPVAVHVRGGPVDAGTLPLTTPDVTGTVFAPDGVTPATARVILRQHGRFIQSDLALSGTLRLGGLLSGTYRVHASPVAGAPFWESPPQPLTLTSGVTQTISLTLRPATVVGRITDPTGAPVAGAAVRVLGQAQHQLRVDRTGPGGHFAIGALPPDTYTLTAEPPAHAAGLISSAPITLTVPPAFSDVGDVPLRGAPKRVDGHVMTHAGIPVADARIIANRRDAPGRHTTLSDPAGGYTLTLGSGLWSVTVSPTPASDPAGWIYPHPPQMVHFDADPQPEHKRVNFRVTTADATVTGIVALPGGGAPPFTVTVALRTPEGVGQSTAINPATGSFILTVPHGRYLLHVRPHDPGYAGPAPLPVYAPISDTVDVGTLTLLARDATLSGVVSDGAGGGVGGVQVVAWARDHQGAQTHTQPDGSFTLPVVAGSWLLQPSVPPTMPFVYQGTAVSVTLTSQQHITDVDFSLTPAPNPVTGQLVTGSDRPVSAAGWASAVSDAGAGSGAPIRHGQFSFYLPDGAYDVGARLAAGSRWLPGPAQPITVGGGVPVSVTLPVLPQNAHILATLWDPRAEIVPTGVEGFVHAHQPAASAAAPIDPASGSARLGISAGLWHVAYAVAPDAGYVALNHHLIAPLEAGQSLAVPLPVAPRDSVITGTVTAPDGAPLRGAVVTANGLGWPVNQVTLRAQTDGSGRFRLPLPAGTYNLLAHHGDAGAGWLNPAQHAVTVRPGQPASVTLPFRLSDVTLSGVVSAPAGVSGMVQLWAVGDDGAAVQTAVAAGGVYTLPLLSDSRWRVGAALETSASAYVTRTVVTMGGGDETLDLTLAGPIPKPGPIAITFDAAQPQQLTLADGTRIDIPAGALPVSGQVTLHVTPIATFPHQHHARLYKIGYAFVALDDGGAPITSHFNQNVTIQFSYNAAELARLGLRERHLKPAYYSTSTHSWTVADSFVVDTTNDVVTMQIDHFTDFSLLNDTAVYEALLPVITN